MIGMQKLWQETASAGDPCSSGTQFELSGPENLLLFFFLRNKWGFDLPRADQVDGTDWLSSWYHRKTVAGRDVQALLNT